MAGLRIIVYTRQLQDSLRASRAQVTTAMRRFFQRIATLTEREAIKNTSGKGAPRGYPIPIRSGDLRRSIASEFSATSAMVFSSAEHADAQQAGYLPYGNPKATPIPPRQFTFDAAKSAPVEDELADALARVFP